MIKKAQEKVNVIPSAQKNLKDKENEPSDEEYIPEQKN